MSRGLTGLQMAQSALSRVLLPLLYLVLFSCTPARQAAPIAGSDDRRGLEDLLRADSMVFQRETPFIKRVFKPYRGDQWIGKGISYGCYRDGQAPGVKGPSEAEILEDLMLLKDHWQLIRVYGADDDTERILKVIDEYQLPIRVMVGIWLQNEILIPENKESNVAQVMRGIQLAHQFPEEVLAISVGNETQVFWSGHRMYPETVIQYIRAVRQFTDVPVCTADDFNFWNKPESRAFDPELDFLTFHTYALWNGQQLGHAMTWTDSVYRDLVVRHPDVPIIFGETGWANRYNPEHTGPGGQGTLIKGEVSLAAQAEFLGDLDAWIDSSRVPTFYFEAFDESWKGGGETTGPYEIEKNWGLFKSDRTPKSSFREYLSARAGQE